jgi:hypothetical protein
MIVGVMANGEHRHLATVPITAPESDQDHCR